MHSCGINSILEIKKKYSQILYTELTFLILIWIINCIRLLTTINSMNVQKVVLQAYQEGERLSERIEVFWGAPIYIEEANMHSCQIYKSSYRQIKKNHQKGQGCLRKL